MEQDAATKKIDINMCQSIRAQRICNAIEILGHVKGLGLPDPDLAESVYAGLETLARNGDLWTDAPWSATLQEQFAFAMLVPGGRADKTVAAVKCLRNHKVIPVTWDQTITPNAAMILCQIRGHVRFPSQKAERLARALSLWACIIDIGQGQMTAAETHARLVKQVQGFGPKAAAHFMRNTGLQTMDTDQVPIIDTHIRKLLEALGAVSAGASQALCADAFTDVCDKAKTPMLLVDALAWCVYSGTSDPLTLDFGNFAPSSLPQPQGPVGAL